MPFTDIYDKYLEPNAYGDHVLTDITDLMAVISDQEGIKHLKNTYEDEYVKVMLGDGLDGHTLVFIKLRGELEPVFSYLGRRVEIFRPGNWITYLNLLAREARQSSPDLFGDEDDPDLFTPVDDEELFKEIISQESE